MATHPTGLDNYPRRGLATEPDETPTADTTASPRPQQSVDRMSVTTRQSPVLLPVATSAASRVFDIPELANMIFELVPVRDALLLKRTCKQFHSVLESAVYVQHMLQMTPVTTNNVDPPPFLPSFFRSFRVEEIEPRTQENRRLLRFKLSTDLALESVRRVCTGVVVGYDARLGGDAAWFDDYDTSPIRRVYTDPSPADAQYPRNRDSWQGIMPMPFPIHYLEVRLGRHEPPSHLFSLQWKVAMSSSSPYGWTLGAMCRAAQALLAEYRQTVEWDELNTDEVEFMGFAYQSISPE